MIFMNGYSRCCGMMTPMPQGGHQSQMMTPMPQWGVQPQMMYAMPAPQQMTVKPEMVKVPEKKEKTCETKKAVMTQPQMMCPQPMPYHQGPVHYETCCQVVEPTVCCMPEVHHHHRVEHVVPVMVRTVHHHHNHHDYVICKEEQMECHQYDHGLRQEDWCHVAMTPQTCQPQPKC